MSSAVPSRPGRESPLHRARRDRGFTLVELLVAMVAGLIVALAVVTMSREASNTFHEETRVASAEMQIRSAVDRIRADVSRAAFMSTGNIWIDPQILATQFGSPTNVAGIPNFYKSATGTMSLYSLASLHVCSGTAGETGTCSPAPLGLSAVNNLSPDALEIGGDLTGVEVLTIGGVSGQPAIVPGGGCNGQGQRIYLDVASTPAMWRLVGMNPSGDVATYQQQLANAFQPVPGSSFIVRVVDNTTHKTQYAATCATTPAASWNPQAGGVPQPYVDLDASSSVNLPLVAPNATINPVQIVRWQIQPSPLNVPAGTVADANKYDLTRQYLDALGANAGNPEVVAEYAVDLKFAFSIDNTTDATGNYVLGPNPSEVVYSFEDGSNNPAGANASVGADVTTQGAVPLAAAGPQPQRVRSVRIRLATRSSIQDRGEPLAVPGAPNDYVYRYCLVPNAGQCTQTNPGLPIFARTRTLITEVALPNQARFWYR